MVAGAAKKCRAVVAVAAVFFLRKTRVRTVLRRSFDLGNATTLACEQKKGKEHFFKPGTLAVTLARASPSVTSERVHGPFSYWSAFPYFCENAVGLGGVMLVPFIALFFYVVVNFTLFCALSCSS